MPLALEPIMQFSNFILVFSGVALEDPQTYLIGHDASMSHKHPLAAPDVAICLSQVAGNQS
jgi:hypothetical protein